MIAPQSPLIPFESATVVGLGEAELALRSQQPAQVAGHRERVGVIASQSLLVRTFGRRGVTDGRGRTTNTHA